MSTSEIIEEINCKRNMSTSARDTFEESFENAREAEFAREFMDKFTEGDTSAKRKNRSNDKASVPLRLWNPQPVQPQSESRQDHTEDRGWSFGKFGEGTFEGTTNPERETEDRDAEEREPAEDQLYNDFGTDADVADIDADAFIDTSLKVDAAVAVVMAAAEFPDIASSPEANVDGDEGSNEDGEYYEEDGDEYSINLQVNTNSFEDANSLEDDNPHRDSIVGNLGMKSPAIREMHQNEVFAKRAGLRYAHGYDVQLTHNEHEVHERQADHQVRVEDMMMMFGNHGHPIEMGPRHGLFNGIRDFQEASSINDNSINDDVSYLRDEHGNELPPNMNSFLSKSHGVDQLRLLAGRLNADWRDKEFMAPALARRMRDFQFAQEKRRKKYGNERPWGILGLYDHLAAVRMDVEWAEDAAWRRANGEPYCAWADFEESKSSGINRPFFTYFILLLCTVTLIVSIGMNGWVVEPVSVNPMIGPSAETLVKMGAKETYLIVSENQAWRLVSPMALHAGLIHYFLNMLALWFIGSAVEKSHGFIPALVLFTIPAIGGTVLSAIFLPEYISVGASGGIFGLIGACLSDIVMNWNLIFSNFTTEDDSRNMHVMVLVLLFLDILLNGLLGLTPFVDNFTHLGGMIFGFLCGLSTMERVSSDFFGENERLVWSHAREIFVRFFGLIVSIASIMAATIILLEGDGVTNPCSACSALSCIPFPPWADQTNKWWYCDDCGTVTADARVNPSTGVFHQLDMTCPDGSIQNIELDFEPNTDKASLESKLPSFCRKHCPTLKKSS